VGFNIHARRTRMLFISLNYKHLTCKKGGMEGKKEGWEKGRERTREE
jgi:hypothetical protein